MFHIYFSSGNTTCPFLKPLIGVVLSFTARACLLINTAFYGHSVIPGSSPMQRIAVVYLILLMRSPTQSVIGLFWTQMRENPNHTGLRETIYMYWLHNAVIHG